MIVSEHPSKSGLIISLCDAEIAGKKYSESGLVLDLSSDFYKGKKLSEDEAGKKCGKAYIINAVGEKSVALIKRLGFVSEKNIIIVGGIPFAQCLVIENEI